MAAGVLVAEVCFLAAVFKFRIVPISHLIFGMKMNLHSFWIRAIKGLRHGVRCLDGPDRSAPGSPVLDAVRQREGSDGG